MFRLHILLPDTVSSVLICNGSKSAKGWSMFVGSAQTSKIQQGKGRSKLLAVICPQAANAYNWLPMRSVSSTESHRRNVNNSNTVDPIGNLHVPRLCPAEKMSFQIKWPNAHIPPLPHPPPPSPSCSWIWILQDLLGIAFCLNFMKTISLSNFKVHHLKFTSSLHLLFT